MGGNDKNKLRNSKMTTKRTKEATLTADGECKSEMTGCAANTKVKQKAKINIKITYKKTPDASSHLVLFIIIRFLLC